MSSRRSDKPIAKMTALEAKWEAVLRAEGLGERSLFDYSPSDQIRFVSTDAIEKALESSNRRDGNAADVETLSYELNGGQVSWTDHPTAQLFRALSAAIHRLPPTWPARSSRFLLEYVESGNMAQAARTTKVSVRQAGRYLQSFNAHAASIDVVQFPRPCETRKSPQTQTKKAA